ncbi:DUF2085 domain-containing protein [Chloroflexota bacterium]
MGDLYVNHWTSYRRQSTGSEKGDEEVAPQSGQRRQCFGMRYCGLNIAGPEVGMVAGRERRNSRAQHKDIPWLGRHWLLVVNLAMVLFIGGTLLPPLLMYVGLEGPARIAYTLYGLNCHQLPQRSYFLFGPNGVNTYSFEQVIALGGNPNNLNSFVGNAEVGFKLGMAQRNTAIFTTFFLAGLAYALLRKRVPGLRWPVLLLLILPMALDGGSHMASELTAHGFRETNGWLATLTGGVFPETFYAGTTAGSFNWLMRTLTGALFAVGCVWFAFPHLDRGFGRSGLEAPPELSRTRGRSGPRKQTRTEGVETL